MVQFTPPTEHNRKWAQLVCQNLHQSMVYVLLAFNLFLREVGIKSVPMLPFCISMMQTTPIWFHLWCQACPLCQALRDRSVVFPVPGWGALIGNGRDVNCTEKRVYCFAAGSGSQPQPFRRLITCTLKFVLLNRNKIQYRSWQSNKLYFSRKNMVIYSWKERKRENVMLCVQIELDWWTYDYKWKIKSHILSLKSVASIVSFYCHSPIPLFTKRMHDKC